jgi:hypothetical protein
MIKNYLARLFILQNGAKGDCGLSALEVPWPAMRLIADHEIGQSQSQSIRVAAQRAACLHQSRFDANSLWHVGANHARSLSGGKTSPGALFRRNVDGF